MPHGSVVARHGPPPSRQWEGIAQDWHPPGETFDESPLRLTQPVIRTRGSPASMALERLPPTCVAGRGDGVCGWDVQDHASGWETRGWEMRAARSAEFMVRALGKAHSRSARKQQLMWNITKQAWVYVDAPARTPLTKMSFKKLQSEAREKAQA